MSIWWVNTGARFREQKEAGALWCPNRSVRKDKSLGPPQWHWSIIQEVRAGEFVVVARDGFIEGVAVAKTTALPNRPKPHTFPDQDSWNSEGWLLPVELITFDKRISRESMSNGLFRYAAPRSPFRIDEDGKIEGNQVYFAELPGADAPEFFERIRIALEMQRPGGLDDALATTAETPESQPHGVKATTREAIIQARVGQGQFRESLMTMWASKCCATGLEHKNLLRASHIVAWSAATDHERLSPFNGLLLSAAYDAAFDAHLITLNAGGEWENVAGLKPEELNQAGLGNLEDQKVIGLKDEHFEYLVKHNQNARVKWAKLQ
ncbi:hypothetical protein RU07_15970 [Agrobacterium tumefaciens]|uniref:HNH nuclease domain-containing protein n=1 Tax=Agrobacterium tumefaciens TaxID=358 RepID=A0A0D0KSC8_AGRTU|nr:hypothetical protein RU07_15970 [Agrobacterium tumefaciens]